jgi:hypothetical protein
MLFNFTAYVTNVMARSKPIFFYLLMEMVFNNNKRRW